MSYVKEAQARAKRRKSPWNLLLIPAALIPLALIWAGTVTLAVSLHSFFYPGQTLSNATGIGSILATASPFFGSVPLALLLGNVFVRSIPPARRALDLEAGPGTSFNESQAQLRKLAIHLVPGAIVVSVLGSCLPW